MKYKYYNGFAIVLINNKYGFINENEVEICKCKYDMVWDFRDDFARVYLNDKFGFINQDGKEVVPCKYNFLKDKIQLEKYKLKLQRKSKLDIIL